MSGALVSVFQTKMKIFRPLSQPSSHMVHLLLISKPKKKREGKKAIKEGAAAAVKQELKNVEAKRISNLIGLAMLLSNTSAMRPLSDLERELDLLKVIFEILN